MKGTALFVVGYFIVALILCIGAGKYLKWRGR